MTVERSGGGWLPMMGEPRAETPHNPIRQMSEHLITPPPELVQQWWDFADQHCDRDDPKTYFDDIATQAARWGADIELEACCEQLAQLVRGDRMAEYLRATRRKPQTLKQQALEALKHAPGADYPSHITLLTADEHALIRSALEALPDG